MRADQGRIKEILKETILALLNNGVEFNSELEVDGLLGVTVDRKDVFLVKISEVVPSLKRQLGAECESSDEDVSTQKASSSSMMLPTPGKMRRKRRSPSPKQVLSGSKNEKRQRVASPTQSIPSSTSQKDIKAESGAGGDFEQTVDIDLTSVKMEPVDTTVSDSNPGVDDMSDVGPNFDYNQQQPLITSIQAVSQQQQQQSIADSRPGCSTWQAPPQTTPLDPQTDQHWLLPKSTRRSYHAYDLECAVTKIIDKEVSLSAASRHYDIPKSTLFYATAKRKRMLQTQQQPAQQQEEEGQPLVLVYTDDEDDDDDGGKETLQNNSHEILCTVDDVSAYVLRP